MLRNRISIISIFLICIHAKPSHQRAQIHRCPIGFTLTYTNREEPICHRRKGPETFDSVYDDCIGNLYSTKLYHDLNITSPDHPIWTEYKTYYPGGLFIDRTPWFYGSELNLTDIIIEPIGVDEELCLLIDPVRNYTAVKCNEMHYRYCFVKPYPDVMDYDGCDGLKDSWRFRSPESTCITALDGVGGGAVRATWTQARKLCSDKGGSLLYRGWRYANSPLLNSTTIPLGVVMSSDFSMLRYDALEDYSEIPPSKWNFADEIHNADTLLGSQTNDFWYLVNCSYIFYEVVCERVIPLRNLSMFITIDLSNKIFLTVSDMLSEDDIMCYTDSFTRKPYKIYKKRISTNVYVLEPKKNGYYWCTHANIMDFKPSISNTALYIKNKRNVHNVYAIKFKDSGTYSVDTLQKLVRIWSFKIREYIFYKTKYERAYGDIVSNDTDKILNDFKTSNPALDSKYRALSLEMRIKRLYFDSRTVLAHVTMEPDLGLVSPGFWDGIEILSMKPVYFCPGFDNIAAMPLGQSVNTVNCLTHSCVGDFNEGVQWITTATAACPRNPTVHSKTIRLNKGSSESSEETNESSLQRTNTLMNTSETVDKTILLTVNTTESFPTETTFFTTTTFPYTDRATVECPEEVPTVTLPTPTRPPLTLPPPTRPPLNITTETPTTTDTTTTDMPEPTSTTAVPREEQLQQVLDDLDRLLNTEAHILVNDLDNVFDQVDVLLEEQDELEIPGQLLHLLDQLGPRVVLKNGTGSAIRPNIALLMADAQPDHPIRGIRIASSGSDTFTDNSFDFISQAPNTSVLNSEESEVVVNLPSSVSETQRRVSFVVFRNDRAFQAESLYAVNSRVLSVNVENVTRFYGGEVIDIHLSPRVTDPNRNESRACAYWQFQENGRGYWSQEGCTFIRATQKGMLDTCRCDHLTHFAEILVEKSVFSEKNEDILELITIVGCAMSLFGLFMIGVTAALFRSWRREYSNKVWLHLSIAIFILVASFSVVIFIKFETYDVKCMLIGALLHYSVLASFCWMLMAAILAYRRLVLVFTKEASHKLLKASVFSWGAPSAVVGILLSVAPHSYAGRFEEKTPSGSFCYPSGLSLWLTVYAPIAVILLANWILFSLIVRSVFASRRIQRHGETNEALRCASVSCLLVFLFGLPWIFGLFAFNIVLAYLFTVSATYQGFILFLFFVLGNKKTRDLWLNKLKIRQTRKVPVTSSTYTNRSADWRAGNPTITLEAKASKPKVLSSKDESRFS